MGMFEKSKPVEDINQYCKIVGVIFMALGVLHFILSGFLSAWWGGLLIVLGIIILSYRAKSMIIVVGVALIIVGLLNMSTIFYEVNMFWLIFSVFQIVWGVQELKKYPNTKENPKYIIKKKEKKGFIWYGLRVSFFLLVIMIISERIFTNQFDILSESESLLFWSLVCIELILLIGTFIISIIHLVKYKKKGLAITILMVSLIIILFSIFAFFYGFSFGALADFNEGQITDMENYCDSYCYDYSDYEYYLVNYDYIKEKPVCYCLDGKQEVFFDDVIPSRVYE